MPAPFDDLYRRYQQMIQSGQLRGATTTNAMGQRVGSYVDPSIVDELKGLNTELARFQREQGGVEIDPRTSLWVANPAVLPNSTINAATGTPRAQQEAYRSEYPQPPMSPEAQTSQDRGEAQTTGPTQPMAERLRTSGFGQPQAAAPPAPPAAPPPEAGGPALPLAGKSIPDQVTLLGNFLKQHGFPSDFVSGGTSPIDPQINALIEQINQTTDPAQQRLLAQQLSSLAGQRGSVATGATYQWNSAGGQVTPIGATPGTTPTGQPTTTTTQTPTTATPTTKPLDIAGKPYPEQAKILSDFLKKNGYNINFTVGGTSPLDAEIINLINQINAGNTDPNVIDQLAQLAARRGAQTTNPSFDFRPDVGGGTAVAPGSRTPTDFIANLDKLFTTPERQVPGVNQDLYNRLIEQMAGGGDTELLRTTQEGQLVSDLERASGLRKQQLADRLASTGIQGGRGLDLLSDIDADALNARATGLAGIRSSILQMQQRAKETALDAMLRQIGLSSAESQQIASLLTNRQVAQAQLGQQAEQFQSRLGLDTLGLDNETLGLKQQGDRDRWNAVYQLLALGQNASQADRAAINDLVQQLLGGGTNAGI